MDRTKSTSPSKGYIEGEEIPEIKHEYIAGQVYVMSGGTANHNTVAMNFVSETRAGLELPEAGVSISLADLYLDVELNEEA